MVKTEAETFEIIKVATATEDKIKSNISENELTLSEAICQIMNDVKEIKRLVE